MVLDRSAIAGRIKILRGRLSQRQFAKRVGFNQVYISEIETGKTKPSIDILVAIATEFETSVDFVLRGGKLERIYKGPSELCGKLKERQ